jgi:hypothetical protein
MSLKNCYYKHCQLASISYIWIVYEVLILKLQYYSVSLYNLRTQFSERNFDAAKIKARHWTQLSTSSVNVQPPQPK